MRFPRLLRRAGDAAWGTLHVAGACFMMVIGGVLIYGGFQLEGGTAVICWVAGGIFFLYGLSMFGS